MMTPTPAVLMQIAALAPASIAMVELGLSMEKASMVVPEVSPQLIEQ